MGKRSDFKRVERDYYPTPIKAVEPLVPLLPQGDFSFVEPCAGDGRLVNHLQQLTSGKCTYACDIEPQENWIREKNALDLRVDSGVDYIITNPPWDVKLLHPMIEHFSKQKPTWLLFYADWMHTVQAKDLLKKCQVIKSVGRVKWIEGSKHTGKDNCAWYLFGDVVCSTVFVGR